MAFKTGMQHLQNTIKDTETRAQAAQAGGAGRALGYINWKPGEKKILRFLTDDLITEDVYDFIVDNTGNTKNFLADPEDPDRLKRYMSPNPGIGWRKEFGTGKLVEPRGRPMGINIAVVRQELPAEEPGRTKVEDLLYDREIDGTTYPSRTFGIVMMGVKNFWNTLANACFTRYGSICTLDYEITRTGEGRDTQYVILPLREIPDLSTIEQVQGFYFYGQEWSENDDLRYLKCPMTVHQWAANFSSEDRYKYWLGPKDGSVQQQAQAAPSTPSGGNGLGEFHPATTHNDEAQAQQTSGTTFASLTDTLLKHAPKS